MSDRDRDRDRPKKSWRDIDKQRDGARSSEPRRDDARSRAQEDRASKAYRAQLDALFERGEVGKLAEKLASGRADSLIGPPMPAAKKPEPTPAPAAEAPKPAPTEKPDDPRAVLRKKILTAIGRDEISRAVDKYVKAHGMPRDFEVLEQALEHNKDERIVEALTVLESMLEREKPKRSRTMLGKLRFIEETSGDPELVAFAGRVRQKLG